MTHLMLGPIVGGLNHRRAFLWGRSAGPGILHAWLGERPDLSDARLAGKSLPLTGETGFAGVAPVHDLTPDTCYYYALTLSDSSPEAARGPYSFFRTFPLPGERRAFNFAFGSCFRPANEEGGQIFDVLEAHRHVDDLRFLMLLGDQVYADDYHYHPLPGVAVTLEDYRSVYKYVWSRPRFRQILSNLPSFMTLDDHEVDDDWRWIDSNRLIAYIPWWDRLKRLLVGRPRQERLIPRQRVQDALQAYWEHQAMHAPPLELPPELNPEGQYNLSPLDPGSLAYSFTYGAAAFFVLDTRSMRVRGRDQCSMLGEGQWKALESWLLAVKDTYPVKFLVSSCAMLFHMFIDIPRDRWSGFPQERDRLLHFLAAHGIEDVYLLCGDLHSAHAVRAELYGPEGRALPLWEFCSSPFEQEPNWLARLTRIPLRSGIFKHQQCFFIQAKTNFGIVRVDFAAEGKPSVRFEVYGEKGDLLGKAG